MYHEKVTFSPHCTSNHSLACIVELCGTCGTFVMTVSDLYTVWRSHCPSSPCFGAVQEWWGVAGAAAWRKSRSTAGQQKSLPQLRSIRVFVCLFGLFMHQSLHLSIYPSIHLVNIHASASLCTSCRVSQWHIECPWHLGSSGPLSSGIVGHRKSESQLPASVAQHLCF